MADLKLPPDFEIPFAVKDNDDEAMTALVGFNSQKPGPFNYEPFRGGAFDCHRGQFTEKHIKDFCAKIHPESGREPNKTALMKILDLPKARKGFAVKLPARKIFIRKDLGFTVRPQYASKDENGQKKITIFQPRKSHPMTLWQYGLVASLIRFEFCKNDLADAVVEIVDLQAAPGEKDRDLQVYYSNNLPVFDDSFLLDQLSRIVRAYDKLKALGFTRPKRGERRAPKDPRQQELLPPEDED